MDQKHTPGQRTETVCTTRKTSQPRTSLLTQPQSQANHPPHTLPMNQARVMTIKGYCDLLLSDDELDVDMLDDIITSSCTCGANNRAHKRTCPMSSRAQYPTGRQHRTPKHKPGDYVDLHSVSVKDKHLTCWVIECLTKPAANLYRLSCTNVTGYRKRAHFVQEMIFQNKQLKYVTPLALYIIPIL